MKAKSAGILALLLVITIALCALSYFGIDVKDKNAVVNDQDSNVLSLDDLDVSMVSDTEGSEAADAPDGDAADSPGFEIELSGASEATDTESAKTAAPAKNLFGVKNIKQGLDLSGGVYIVYEADKENPTADEMAAAVALIRGRLDRKGYTEAEAFKEGSKRIRVNIPGVEDAETAISEIGRTAQLSFMDEENIEKYFSGEEAQAAVTGDQVTNAYKSMVTDSSGLSKIVVNLEFSSTGTAAFAEATRNNLGKPLYIVLDDDIISAPTVNTEITDGKAYIEGSFDVEYAEELSAQIRAGSLPFNLNVMEMNKIGATLGANALDTSIFAGIIGFICVLVFMIVFYRVSGFASAWALVIYIALDLITLSVLGVTLTLPGIAGIILSVGMAVDANVIIFERIKEELNEGKILRTAMGNGFSRALPAILDSNITTIIAGLVLLWLGTGSIKGFAQTLIIGIILSMFTALFVTRLILTHLMGVGINNPKFYGRK